MVIPRIPDAGPRSLEDVLDYARTIEAKINAGKRVVSQEVLLELGGNLDLYSARLYANQPIIVSGLHKVVKPDPEDPTDVISVIQQGIAQGEAQGFSVCEVEALEPNLDDKEQYDAFETLRSRVGRYAVSQLATHGSRFISSPNQGVINKQMFQIVAPIKTNDILLDRPDDPDPAAVYKHSRDILATTNPMSREQVRQITNALIVGPHTLESLMNVVPTINTFLAHNADVYKDALADMVGCLFPKSVFSKVYEAASLPPVYVASNDRPGTYDICRIDLPSSQIAFDDLLFFQRYFIGKEGKVIAVDSAPPGMFMGAVSTISPWGQTIKFHVPLEHIQVEGDKVYNRYQ